MPSWFYPCKVSFFNWKAWLSLEELFYPFWGGPDDNPALDSENIEISVVEKVSGLSILEIAHFRYENINASLDYFIGRQ
jgi:hypothetical protein